MAVALIAPEALLCAAINQRIDAEILVKKAAEYLPSPQELAKPGIFARLLQYCIPKRAKMGDVSTQYEAFTLYSSSNSLLDLAGAS